MINRRDVLKLLAALPLVSLLPKIDDEPGGYVSSEGFAFGNDGNGCTVGSLKISQELIDDAGFAIYFAHVNHHWWPECISGDIDNK